MVMSDVLLFTSFLIKFGLGNYLLVSSLFVFSFVFYFYKNYKKDNDRKLSSSITKFLIALFIFLIYSVIHKIIVKDIFLDSQYHFLTYFFSTFYISSLLLIMIFTLNSFSNRDFIIELKMSKKPVFIILSFTVFFMLIETFIIEKTYLTFFFSLILIAIYFLIIIIRSDDRKNFVLDRVNMLFIRNPSLKNKLKIDYGEVNEENLFVTKFNEIFTQSENRINEKKGCIYPGPQVFFNEISKYNKMSNKNVTIDFDGKILKEVLKQHNIEDDDIFILYIREDGLEVIDFEGKYLYTFGTPKQAENSTL